MIQFIIITRPYRKVNKLEGLSCQPNKTIRVCLLVVHPMIKLVQAWFRCSFLFFSGEIAFPLENQISRLFILMLLSTSFFSSHSSLLDMKMENGLGKHLKKHVCIFHMTLPKGVLPSNEDASTHGASCFNKTISKCVCKNLDYMDFKIVYRDNL